MQACRLAFLYYVEYKRALSFEETFEVYQENHGKCSRSLLDDREMTSSSAHTRFLSPISVSFISFVHPIEFVHCFSAVDQITLSMVIELFSSERAQAKPTEVISLDFHV